MNVGFASVSFSKITLVYSHILSRVREIREREKREKKERKRRGKKERKRKKEKENEIVFTLKSAAKNHFRHRC